MLRGHADSIEQMELGPDGFTLATTSDDGDVRPWRALPEGSSDAAE